MYKVSNLRLTPPQYQAEPNPSWRWVSTCSLTINDVVRVHNIKLKIRDNGPGKPPTCRIQFPLERKSDGSIRSGDRGPYETAHPVSAEARRKITLLVAKATKEAMEETANTAPDMPPF